MTQPITSEEFSSRIKIIAGYDSANENWMDKYRDHEHDHRVADDLICEILESLGYSEGIKIFKDMTRWYA